MRIKKDFMEFNDFISRFYGKVRTITGPGTLMLFFLKAVYL